jgi:glutamyl-tRNA synthetase
VQERVQTLEEGAQMLRFLFVGAQELSMDEAAVAKNLGPEGQQVLSAAVPALTGLGEWSTGAIEAALRTALLDGLGLKPRVAFGPLRVAITGRQVSPPLFESMELLGREETLRRLDRARSR